MYSDTYIAPKFKADVFTCLYCRKPATQTWHKLSDFSFGRRTVSSPSQHKDKFNNIRVSKCGECEKPTIWDNEDPVYPFTGHQPPPHPDMPENIRMIYEEAASISQLSPRASCALMRYAIEELIKSMGYKGRLVNIIDKMNEEKVISKQIHECLHIVRLTGNNASHGNAIDMNDTTRVRQICMLLNQIVEELITQPKMRKSLLSEFSDSERERIEKRDKDS